jgi:hypothetical protein
VVAIAVTLLVCAAEWPVRWLLRRLHRPSWPLRIWLLVAGGLTVLLAVVGFVLAVGLDRADKLSSVVSAVLGAVGLFVSLLLIPSRRNASGRGRHHVPPSRPAPAEAGPPGAAPVPAPRAADGEVGADTAG